MDKNNPIADLTVAEIKELKKSYDEIEKRLGKVLEDRNVETLERLCFEVKAAIIGHTLAFPEVSTVERYLNKLTDRDNVTYIIELLHQCWRYANPDIAVFDKPLDTTKTQDQLLDIFLSKYSDKTGKSLDLEVLYITEPTKEEIMYASANTDYHSYARQYLTYIHRILLPVCSKFGLAVDERFIVSRKLRTSLSPKQVKAVFSVILAERCVTKSDKDNFLSLFSCFPTVPTGTIAWLSVATKSKETNVALLFTLFDAMGIELNKVNREFIAEHFVKPNGDPISADAIKKRGDSAPQRQLRQLIQKAI